jgi:amino acid permease
MARPNRAAAPPRWVTITFLMIVALILWIGVLQMPGIDSIIYVAAVIAVAVLLAYADHKGRS